jgi:hypothetical protein
MSLKKTLPRQSILSTAIKYWDLLKELSKMDLKLNFALLCKPTVTTLKFLGTSLSKHGLFPHAMCASLQLQLIKLPRLILKRVDIISLAKLLFAGSKH